MRADSRRIIPRTGQYITALGLGSAPLGGLYSPVATPQALDIVKTAWVNGIRYFDTAPMYGLGRAEHLIGHQLRMQQEQEATTSWVLATKVGRLMQTAHAGRQLPPIPPKNPLDPGWHNGLSFQEIFDYSYDGIMRSYEDSQQRLGFPTIDMLYVHDIGILTHGDLHIFHWQNLTKGGGFKALNQLKSAGNIKGFGLGVNEWQVIRDALDETDLDCCLLAGRYTLLDQSAAPDFLDLAIKRNVAILAAGVFNSGILAATSPVDQKFNYATASDDILQRVEKIKNLCQAFGVAIAGAAMHFPLRHKAITAIVVGAKTPEQIQQNIDLFNTPIAEEFWQEFNKHLSDTQ